MGQRGDGNRVAGLHAQQRAGDLLDPFMCALVHRDPKVHVTGAADRSAVVLDERQPGTPPPAMSPRSSARSAAVLRMSEDLGQRPSASARRSSAPRTSPSARRSSTMLAYARARPGGRSWRLRVEAIGFVALSDIAQRVGMQCPAGACVPEAAFPGLECRQGFRGPTEPALHTAEHGMPSPTPGLTLQVAVGLGPGACSCLPAGPGSRKRNGGVLLSAGRRRSGPRLDPPRSSRPPTGTEQSQYQQPDEREPEEGGEGFGGLPWGLVRGRVVIAVGPAAHPFAAP